MSCIGGGKKTKQKKAAAAAAANHWMYYLNVCVCVQNKRQIRKLYMMMCFTGSKYSDTGSKKINTDAVFYYNALIFGDVF